MSQFQRSTMHAFHQKINAKESQRTVRKAGKRSSPQHRLTHILLKFEQLIDYGIKECKDSFKHENLGERYDKLFQRRNHLHRMGEKLIQKTKLQSCNSVNMSSTKISTDDLSHETYMQ